MDPRSLSHSAWTGARTGVSHADLVEAKLVALREHGDGPLCQRRCKAHLTKSEKRKLGKSKSPSVAGNEHADRLAKEGARSDSFLAILRGMHTAEMRYHLCVEAREVLLPQVSPPQSRGQLAQESVQWTLVLHRIFHQSEFHRDHSGDEFCCRSQAINGSRSGHLSVRASWIVSLAVKVMVLASILFGLLHFGRAHRLRLFETFSASLRFAGQDGIT